MLLTTFGFAFGLAAFMGVILLAFAVT